MNNLLKNTLNYNIKNNLFSKITTLPSKIFDQIRAGEFISRIEEDTAIIAKFYIEDLLNIIISIATVLFTGYFIFKLSLSLSLIAIASFPFTFFIYYIFGKKIKQYSQEGRTIKDGYFGFIQESLISIKEIKCLAIEKTVSDKFNDFSNKFIKNNMKVAITSTFSGLCNISFSSLIDLIIIVYGAWLIISERLSVGSYVAFNGYIAKFFNAVQSIISTNITIQATVVSLERIYYLLDTENEKINEKDEFTITKGRITIRDLHFAYSEINEEVLKNVSLDIEPNSMSTIVGMNGCGKSTLLNLLVRLYDHNFGEILIDNIPIKDMSLKSLRQNIAYIRQQPFLFNGSIKQNLLLANPLATCDEMREACKIAFIDDYIQSLPNKYETLIGEGGIILSGGQKQRLSVARAVLKNAKILLLDEITSDLDGESENFVMNSIYKLSHDHVVIMVAHRLSSIIDSPKIYVMNDGMIEDEGTNEELLEKCDLYRRLFKKYIQDNTGPL